MKYLFPILFLFAFKLSAQTSCRGAISLTPDAQVRLSSPENKYYAASGFTWEAWVKLKQFNNTNTNITLQGHLFVSADENQCEDISISFGWFVGVPANTLCFFVDQDGGCASRDNSPCSYQPSGGFLTNQWYHIAAVKNYNTNQTFLYFNGNVVDSQQNFSQPILRNMLASVGAYYSPNYSVTTPGMNATYDDIRIWNYARTHADIKNNYNQCLQGNETGLITYFNCNDSTTNKLTNIAKPTDFATFYKTVNRITNDNAPILKTCYVKANVSINKTICNGQSFLGHSTTGNYSDTLPVGNGCDSVVNTNLTVLPAPINTKDTLMGCGTVVFNSVSYTSNQIVITTTKNYLGCDSIIQLHQIIITNKKDTTNKILCIGQKFWGHASSFDTTFRLLNNCDSIVRVNITFLNPPTIKKDTAVNCARIVINGVTFTKDTLVNYLSLPYKNYGCDSVQFFKQVLIKPLDTTFSAVSICKGNSYWGRTVSGIYDSIFKTSSSCDSIVRINLTVNSTIADTLIKYICYGDTFRNSTIASNFIDTIKTMGTCDTIRLTKLIVRNKIVKQLPISGSVCATNGYLLNAGNFRKYLWNTGDTTPTIIASTKGWYFVLVTDSFNCKAKDSFNLVNVYPNPYDFLQPNFISACLGEKYTLNGFVNYEWNSGEMTNEINLMGLPMYWVKVTDVNGCIGKDTLKVAYLNSLLFNIPNAFSPNGDKINDEFKPFAGSNCLVKYTIQIYNRWGQKVFEKIDPNKGWDGTLNGKPLPTDAYFYIINYKTITGVSDTKSGCITLLR